MAKNTFAKRLTGLIFLTLVAGGIAAAQTQPPTPSLPAGTADEKSEEVMKRAVTALGGDKYLKATTVISSGNFTAFAEGLSGGFYSFADYTLYPDNERTEFKTNGIRTVQTYTGQTGWMFDGQVKAIRDMKPNQIEDFQMFVLRASVENLLRGTWRSSGATVKHVGRREAGLGRRNDALRLLYPDGFAVEFEFGPDALPAKVIYTRKDADGEEAKEEDRLAQWVDIDGIHTPFIIDHYRGGKQQSRVNYKSVDFNKPLSASFFTRPATVKELK